jgi:tRNA modification GTPase
MVNAFTETSAKVALNQLEGNLSKRIKSLRNKLLEIKAYIEAAVDFPEEEVEILESSNVKNRLEELIKEMENLLSSYEKGRILTEGIRVAIVGRPNVGKSSLLNSLLQEERAIVTEIPGTTRDIIEESINLKGVPIKLIDTAGIREAAEEVERIGIERTLKKLQEADIVLFMIDGSKGFTEEDKKISKLIENSGNKILVINKKDLGLKIKCENLKEKFESCVEISAKTEEGINNLSEIIFKKLILDPQVILKKKEPLITNVRQKNLLENAINSLQKVISSLEGGYESPEFLSMDIDDALKYLGEIVGEVTTEDMLDIIFSRFCIGK